MTPRAGKKAVVLLSGGLDSATALAVARRKGFACHAISFDYGQRHRHELAAARDVTRALGAASHAVIKVDLASIGGSALTDRSIAVPKGRTSRAIGRGIPVTYVPARNLIFLSLAAAHAEVIGAADLFIGVNAIDYSGYPDCREQFIRAFQRAATLGTRAGTQGGRTLRVHTPLIRLSKSQIIRLGSRLGVDFALTTSCYDPPRWRRANACGRCDACILRRQGFKDAGVPDPTRYAARGARS